MLVVIFLITLFIKGYDTACTEGFESHQGSCYFFSHDQESWTGAFETCILFGAKLVEVETSAEDSYISSKARALGNYWWTGLNDKLVKGKYFWQTSGDVLDTRSFSNWAANEPDGGAREDCVCYAPSLNYQWGDASVLRRCIISVRKVMKMWRSSVNSSKFCFILNRYHVLSCLLYLFMYQ